MLGFALNNIPVASDVHPDKLVVLTAGAGVGILLCVLWLRGLHSGEGWMEHWKCALRQWEEVAFGDVNLYRVRPSDLPKSASGAARKAALLFLLVWFLVEGYLVGSLLQKILERHSA
jgi:hypothetical protein